MTIKKEPVLKGIRVNLTKFGIVYYFENEEDRSEFLKSTSFESLLEFRLKLTNEKEYALKYHTDHQINDFEDLPQKLKKELKKRKKKEKETIWSFLYDYDDSLIKLLVEVFINTFKMIDDMVEKSKNVKIGEYFTISNYGKCINPIDLYFGINKITGHRPLIIPNLGYLSLKYYEEDKECEFCNLIVLTINQKNMVHIRCENDCIHELKYSKDQNVYINGQKVNINPIN